MYIEFKCFAISLHCKICRVNHHFAYVRDISVGDTTVIEKLLSFQLFYHVYFTVCVCISCMWSGDGHMDLPCRVWLLYLCTCQISFFME